MATNPKIKKALLDKLKVTPQRLSQRVKARKTELPMTTQQAVYTLAHENGVDVSKHLSPEETADIRALVHHLRGAAPTSSAPTNGTRTKTTKAPTTKVVKVVIAGVDVGTIPGLSTAHAAEAKVMSEKVYPTLYIFENSVRDIIERVLRAVFGDSWWTTAVPGTIQKTAAKHKADEDNDPWHGRRGQREIDYVFLNDLWAIIKHQWKHFKMLFPNQAWVESLVTSDMNVSRRVLAHMNPLAADDVKNIEAAFRKWAKQLKAVEAKLP